MYKIISSHDINIHKKYTKQYLDCILEHTHRLDGCIDKFKTGYGWNLNTRYLFERKVITNRDFDMISNWFHFELKDGQIVSWIDWFEYSFIKNQLNQLLIINR